MRTLRRIRHARSLVERTLRRDLRRRQVRLQDSTLRLRNAEARIIFDAPAPHFSRELPALTVPLQSPRTYQETLEEEIANFLSDHKIPFVPVRAISRPEITFGVLDSDWLAMLHAFRTSGFESLYGGGSKRAHSSRPLYLDHMDVRAFASSRILHLMRPAIARHNGDPIKRFGFECTVKIERWRTIDTEEEGPRLVTPRLGSARTPSINAGAFSTAVSPDSATRALREPISSDTLFEVTFPIDVVYTWVDGTDPEWISRKRATLDALVGEEMSDDAAADLRFIAHDELRHSLRSLEQYAPWVRHVYIVTDRQRPDWLRNDDPWVTVVDHTEIAPPGTALPTFNSQAIEANLHRIEGLSENFLYFNDDVFLSSPVSPELFFSPNGIASMYLSRAKVANGAPVLGEPASDSAGKNARAIVDEVCGRRVARKLFHTPFPLRRSVSFEIENRWPDVVQKTRQSSFRRLEDVTLSGALHMNYAYATGRAVTRGIRYRYVNIGSESCAKKLDSLFQDRHILQTFCLNEASQELPPEEVDSLVRTFLAKRFPDTGSFEIPGH